MLFAAIEPLASQHRILAEAHERIGPGSRHPEAAGVRSASRLRGAHKLVSADLQEAKHKAGSAAAGETRRPARYGWLAGIPQKPN